MFDTPRETGHDHVGPGPAMSAGVQRGEPYQADRRHWTPRIVAPYPFGMSVDIRDSVLRAMRRQKITQARLSKLTGVHPVLLCRWLGGARKSVTTTTAERLFTALRLRVAPRKRRRRAANNGACRSVWAATDSPRGKLVARLDKQAATSR